MTNPNNAIGTNGAFGGRTSVNAFNDSLGSYSAGILSGWECSPDSGLDVVLGGDGNVRDVAIAEDNAGNKTTINNISGSPVQVTIGEAPTTNSRIDLIVAYVDNPPTGSATATDNYGACGLIVVEGTASATPVAPNDSAIRTAITADGASGTTAYYVRLAQVTIESGTTDLTNDDIAVGDIAQIGANNIDFTTFPGEQYLGKASSDGSFTLPAGYSIYHVRGEVFYTTSSANAAMQILTSNHTGESWARRIEERDGDGGYEVVGDQFGYTSGELVTLGSSVALGTTGGRVLIDLTFMRGGGNKLLVSGTFNHSGANSSGLATGETPMSSGAGDIPCWFSSRNSPRTFSNANIVITGII